MIELDVSPTLSSPLSTSLDALCRPFLQCQLRILLVVFYFYLYLTPVSNSTKLRSCLRTIQSEKIFNQRHNINIPTTNDIYLQRSPHKTHVGTISLCN